jgi:putative transposase
VVMQTLCISHVTNILMGSRWVHSNTTVYNIGYHLIWCPKYRRKVLVGEVETRLRELLGEKAEEIGVSLVDMEILPDHIHLFVKAPPTASPHWIVQQLKGYSSHELREEFAELRSRLPTLWTRSYYAESVGHVSEESIRKYIGDQKHH